MFAPLLCACLLAPPDAGGAPAGPVPTAAELTAGATPLNPAGTVLLDAANRRVLVRAKVCLRRGALEMLLCLPQTKEHESILVFEGDARTLHAGLTALGLEPGGPVRFSPFVPPRGPKVDLAVHWTGADGAARTANARTWIRTSTDKWYERDLPALPADLTLPQDLELRYDAGNGQLLWYGRMSDADRDRALALTTDETVKRLIREFHAESQPRGMNADFVFAGSGFVTEVIPPAEGEGEATSRTRYLAEGGEVVCVANFQAATIDVAERSSADGQGVLYEAATERIPPDGTPVLLTFTPRREAAATPAGEREERADDAGAGDGAGGDR